MWNNLRTDLRIRLRSLFRRNIVESELNDELRFHFEHEVEKYERSGLSHEDAMRRARLAFGGHEQVKEDCREARGTSFIEDAAQDVRYALRQLRSNPGFAMVIGLTLALSIGANSAIFSVIHGVLLKTLPYSEPDRLVRIFLSNSTYPKFPLNPFDFRDFRARNKSFESMAAFTRGDVQLSGSGTPIRVNAFGITSGYFHTLGLHPQLGREFDENAEIQGNGLQIILSDRLWRNSFAAAPDIVGRKITLNMQPFTVVGVMPPGTEHPGNEYQPVAYGEDVDAWWPFGFGGDPSQRGSHFIEGIGRLKKDVSIDQARAEMNAIMTQLGREHGQDQGWQVLVIPLNSEIVGGSRQLLLVLLGAVAMVLLIACANAANLLLARASTRQREIAVRVALGAPRSRIVRQLLTESLLISFLGGALGLGLALVGVKVLVALLPAGFPRAHDIHVSAPVFLFTLLVCVATGILFGLAPALQASRTDPKQGLHKGSRGSTAGGHQSRLRNALVVSEVGLACVLLIGAGLMLRSFLNILHLDPGFQQEHVLTARVSLPHEGYKNGDAIIHFCDQLAAGLSSLPGVKSAGVGGDLPWTGYDENTGGFIIEGKQPPPHQEFHARDHMATSGYFRALGVPLLRGRFFTAADNEKARDVMIINHAMAEKYWPNEDAVGKRIAFGDNPKEKDWMTIVGIVGDVKDQPDSPGTEPAFWWSALQNPSSSDLSLVVRADADPQMLVDSIRREVARLDPALAVANVQLLNQIVDRSVSTPRFAFVLVGLFAGLAILLAAIGTYGVISYSVTQRTPEFGLRMALGARRLDVMRLVLMQASALILSGTLIGIALALMLARALKSLIYEVSPADPVTFFSIALAVIVIAVFACYIPARKATLSDPMIALRTE
jgi:predicted permease